MDFDDRPPAGTPCIMCRDKGHFCQADEWTAGDSGNGICAPCLKGESCTVILARTKREPPSTNVFEVPRVTQEERKQNQRSIIVDLFNEGKSVKEIVFSCGYKEDFVRETLGDRKRLPTPQVESKPSNSQPRKSYKPRSDAQAREMLKEGYPMQTIMDRTQLSKNTILTIKRELGLLLPPEQKSGSAPVDYKLLADGISKLDPGQTTSIAFPLGLAGDVFEINLRSALMMHPDFKDRQHVLYRTNGRLVGGWVPKGTFKNGEKPVPTPNPIEKPKHETKWGAAISECLKLGYGESTVITLPKNGSKSSLISMLSQHKEACHDKWKLESLRGDDTKCCVTRVEKRPSPFDQTPEPEVIVRRVASDVGRPPSVDREKIETLLEEGTSVRSTAELAGVSTNTVQRIKREFKPGIYDQALESAREELEKIQEEVQRLKKRHGALLAVIQALEAM